jgi:hypothetical protein
MRRMQEGKRLRDGGELLTVSTKSCTTQYYGILISLIISIPLLLL